jgi:hypothetical protein
MSTLAEIAQAKQIAAEVMYDSVSAHAPLLVSWRTNIDRVWDAPEPALVLAEFGTKAVEIFGKSNATVAFLEALQPGCTADRLAKVLHCTVHEDGTVTLTA